MSGAFGRVRVLLAATAWPLLTTYALIVALLAVVNALAPEASFSVPGVLLAGWPGWLAVYQVPLTIAEQPLGVLPLVPTAVGCYLVARSAGDAAERLGYRKPHESVTVIGSTAGMYALVGVTVAVLANGSDVAVEPLAAFTLPALFAALSATAGVAQRCGLLDLARQYVHDAALHGLRAAAFGLAGLLAVASLVFGVSSLASASTMHELFEANAPGFGSGFGMLLLSVLYLPNAVVGSLAFVTGPGFDFGSVSVSPLGFTGGTVPGMPVLAAMPEEFQGWWPVLLVLPAAVGAVVGWTCRKVDPAPLERVRVVAVAGALVAFICVLLGTFAGGQLGTGPFRAVVIPVGLFSVAAFCWIAVPGSLVAWFAGPRPARTAVGAVQEAGTSEDGAQEDGAQEDGAQDDGTQDDGTQEEQGATAEAEVADAGVGSDGSSVEEDASAKAESGHGDGDPAADDADADAADDADAAAAADAVDADGDEPTGPDDSGSADPADREVPADSADSEDPAGSADEKAADEDPESAAQTLRRVPEER